MNAHPRNILLLVTLAVAAATPALGQTESVGVTSSGTQGATSIPDFSGIWRHPSLPGFEPPASGPGPVVNKVRRRGARQPGVSDYDRLVGDHTNPILKPHAAEIVRKYGEITLSGVTYRNPANQCWPEPVPRLAHRQQVLDEIAELERNGNGRAAASVVARRHAPWRSAIRRIVVLAQ